MTDRQALLAAIIANPDEDTPRLVFADFLDEQGDTFFADWATLIRSQVEFAQTERFSPRWLELAREQVRLFAKRREVWEPLWGSRLGSAAFRRGFREARAFFADIKGFQKNFDTYFAGNPLRAIRLFRVEKASRETLVWIARHAAMERVETLDLGSGTFAHVRTMLTKLVPRMPRLRALGLSRLALSARDLGDVLSALAIRGLTALDASQNLLFNGGRVDHHAFHAPALAGLRWLDLGDVWLNAEAIRVLGNSPVIRGLKYLHLGKTLFNDLTFGSEGATALAEGPSIRGVEVLNLSGQRIGSHGVAALVASPLLATVRELDLTNNDIGDEGAALLANCPQVGNLRRLDLGDNGIRETGAEALLTSPHLARLSILNLNDDGQEETEDIWVRLRERFPNRVPRTVAIEADHFDFTEPIP